MTARRAACSAFVIGHLTIKDAAKWHEYLAKVPSTLAPWGGSVLLRARRVEVLCGAHEHEDSVVIQFPETASARGWYQSPGYQALIPLREQAAEMVLVSLGTAPSPG